MAGEALGVKHAFHLEINSLEDFERLCRLIRGESVIVEDVVNQLNTEAEKLKTAVTASNKPIPSIQEKK